MLSAVRFTVTKLSEFQEKGIAVPLPTLDATRPHLTAKGRAVLQGSVAGRGPTVGRPGWNSDSSVKSLCQEAGAGRQVQSALLGTARIAPLAAPPIKPLSLCSDGVTAGHLPSRWFHWALGLTLPRFSA